jgi:cytochrome c6
MLQHAPAPALRACAPRPRRAAACACSSRAAAAPNAATASGASPRLHRPRHASHACCTGKAAPAAAALAAVLLALSPGACRAADTPPLTAALNPPDLFARTCAGCHAGGGNVVDMSHSLRAPDLARDGLSDTKALADLITLGRGKMPGYGEACAPRGACTFGARLAEADIAALAEFVAAQAAAGWPAS